MQTFLIAVILSSLSIISFCQEELGLALCAPGCKKERIGNGFCDKDCNVPPCQYDGGDCCAITCKDGPIYICGEQSGFQCKDPNSNEAEDHFNLKVVRYSQFSIWLNCARGSAEIFEYTLTKDLGTQPRPEHFVLDTHESLRNCQQHSPNGYKHPQCNRRVNSGRDDPYCFDRGHLVTSNHMDDSDIAIKESHFMTNIVPQATGFNQEGGAWYETEVMTECLREETKVKIVGGVTWGDSSRNYFLDSHGIETPEKMWKILMKLDGDENIIDLNAWMMPNYHHSKSNMLDSFLVTVKEIESIIGRNIGAVSETWKTHKPTTSFTYNSCDQS